MRRTIAVIIIAFILGGGILAEHIGLVRFLDGYIANAQTLMIELQQLEDGDTPPQILIDKAEYLEKRFLKRSKVLETLASHIELKEIKVHLAQMRAALSMNAINDAVIFTSAVIAFCAHMRHAHTPQIQHLF
ncbi:MAG: hypothetical protein FWB72_01380 [Firmicutes bacterium]|nr:hypothetical protein [Bacillota bacterium]